jgi:hypothetical protein
VIFSESNQSRTCQEKLAVSDESSEDLSARLPLGTEMKEKDAVASTWYKRSRSTGRNGLFLAMMLHHVGNFETSVGGRPVHASDDDR